MFLKFWIISTIVVILLFYSVDIPMDFGLFIQQIKEDVFKDIKKANEK